MAWYDDPLGFVGDIGTSVGHAVSGVMDKGFGVLNKASDEFGNAMETVGKTADVWIPAAMAALTGGASAGADAATAGASGATAAGADAAILSDAAAGAAEGWGAYAPMGDFATGAGDYFGAEAAGAAGAAGGAAGAANEWGSYQPMSDLTAQPGTPYYSPVPKTPLEQALSMAKTGAPYAQMGMGILNQKKAADAVEAQREAAQRREADATALMTQYRSGQLSGADQAAVAQYRQQQRAAIDQHYAKMGMKGSAMHVAALSQVDQQAETMRQQALQNTLRAGLSAAGVASPALATAASTSLQQDRDAQAAIQQFYRVLAEMGGGQ